MLIGLTFQLLLQPTTAQPTNAPTSAQPTNAPTTAQPTNEVKELSSIFYINFFTVSYLLTHMTDCS